MQKGRVALKTERDSVFLDNTTGLIIPSSVRQYEDDLIDSTYNITDDGTGAFIRTLSVTLPTASILTANSSPIEIIPAQGVGTFIRLISITTKTVFGSSAFATNIVYRYQYRTAPTIATLDAQINFNANSYAVEAINETYGNLGSDVENSAIDFFVKTGNPTSGTGTTLVVSVQYIILSI